MMILLKGFKFGGGAEGGGVRNLWSDICIPHAGLNTITPCQVRDNCCVSSWSSAAHPGRARKRVPCFAGE